MSLWICPTHGLTGPMACCADASRQSDTGTPVEATITFTPDARAGSVQPSMEAMREKLRKANAAAARDPELDSDDEPEDVDDE